MKRRLPLIISILAAFVLLCGGGGIALFSGFITNAQSPFANSFQNCGASSQVDLNADFPGIGRWSAEQVRNAAIIIRVGQEMGVPPRGWIIAVATAMQESTLRNLGHLGPNNDHDSLGLFQQRPSQGWGTPEQIMDPEYASRRFYEKLLTIDGWERMRLTDAAQAVQVSAYPDAYARWEDDATELVNILTGGAGLAGAWMDPDNLRCAGAGDIAASGWTVPAAGPITSGFRTANRPTHNGVDIGAPRGTVIRAAAGGRVTLVRCSAQGVSVSSGSPCDVDGSINVVGCGWYVEITHADNIITRYCHMLRRPDVSVGQEVSPGQPIGLVGSSGRSSGPHLHFEVHINGDRSSAGAIDPIPFMAERGAPLGM